MNDFLVSYLHVIEESHVDYLGAGDEFNVDAVNKHRLFATALAIDVPPIMVAEDWS